MAHAFRTDCALVLTLGYLGLLPTNNTVNQWNIGINKILTFSSRSFRVPTDSTSAARLRGPYWRVSCKPKELAVSLTDADLDTDAGTMRRDDSYVFIKLCNEIIERNLCTML